MAHTIRLVMQTDKPDNNGRYALRLCITKNSIRKYIRLKIFINAEYWDRTAERLIVQRNLKGEAQKKPNKERITANTLLEKYKARAHEIVAKFEMSGIDWTLNQFEDAFLNTSKQGKFKDYLEKHIQTLRDTGHTGNVKCYFEMLRLLGYYDPKLSQRLFADIDLRYVRGFDIFLQKRGNCGNTRKYYFKPLRAILNKAIAEGCGSESTYPFSKGGFEISKLEEATAKRYLPSTYLQKLKDTPAQNPQCEYARRLFLLSYYCFGMSFVDMAMLTSDNLKQQEDGNYIVYKRQKVKNQRNVAPIQIQIKPAIQDLLDKLRATSPVVDNFLLPIVTCAGYSGEQLYNHIRGRYAKYRKYLKELAKELQMENFHLTSYVSRHTLAMTLQQNNIQRAIISQMLGHADLETTNTYLDSFDNTTINKAAEVL